MRNEGLEVVVQPSNQLFTSLAELQEYDTVILADVPRSSGEDADSVSSFTDEQIRMLVRNTEELGCGLIMMGGQNSFGAGGWANTELEKAMPVDFQIKSAKVVPVGALVLNMHAGEIPQANYWQKVVAQEAIKALGPRDYCGLISWNGTDQWLWGQAQGGMVRVGPNRQLMLARIDRMGVGDMPDFDPGMKKAAVALARLTEAANKHMIIISDGDPTPPTQRHDQRARARRRHGDHGGRRLARHPGQPGDAEHRHAHQGQILRRQQRQRAAEDLSARGPAHRPAAVL